MSELNTVLVPLSKGLYVGEIRMNFGGLRENRYSEIRIRVFNATGRTVALVGLSGNISFHVPDNDEHWTGVMPAPSLRADTITTIEPLQEWPITLSQRVEAMDADKLIFMLDNNMMIPFTLTDLVIE